MPFIKWRVLCFIRAHFWDALLIFSPFAHCYDNKFNYLHTEYMRLVVVQMMRDIICCQLVDNIYYTITNHKIISKSFFHKPVGHVIPRIRTEP